MRLPRLARRPNLDDPNVETALAQFRSQLVASGVDTSGLTNADLVRGLGYIGRMGPSLEGQRAVAEGMLKNDPVVLAMLDAAQRGVLREPA